MAVTRRPREALEELDAAARRATRRDAEAVAALGRRSIRPDDILALQPTAGNQAVVQSLERGVMLTRGGDAQLMRQPTTVKKSTKLHSAASKVASVAGVGVDKVLAEFEFDVENGFSEAALVRAATSVAGLAGKSGAGLYAALLKAPAADMEAHWIIAGLVEAKHPDLATAIRLVRDYRQEVWFDLAGVLSGDESAAKLFFEALAPAELGKVWGVVQKEPKLTSGARTRLRAIVDTLAAKAAKVDVEATAKLLAPVAGVSVSEMRENLEIAVGVGFKAADLRRLAPTVLRLAKIKWGAPVFEALLEQPPGDLEALSVLAARLGDKRARFATAVDLMLWYRLETWFMFADRANKDPDAAKLLLDTVPPAELDKMWKGLETSGLDKQQRAGLRGRVEGAMHAASKGDSTRAVRERYRGQEIGKALEKRVDAVLEHTKFRRKGMVANIGRAVGHVDSTLKSLLELADQYKQARARVEETIKRAEAEAKLDQEKMDFILGIAIGVGVGLGLGAAVPLAEGASRAVTAGLDAVGEVYEAKVADLVKGGGGEGAKAPSGDYERADPQVKQTEAYKRCGELYRQLASLAPEIEDVSAVNDVGAKVKADARELATSGSHSTLVIPELERMVATLERADNEMKRAETDVFELQWTLSAEADRARREANRKDQLRLEKQIWIHWLGSRSGDEAELAGRAPVKGVLKAHHIVAAEDEDSSIGWGVGSWHSDENSRTGAKRAAAYSEALSLAGREGELIEGTPRTLSTLRPDPSAGNVRYSGTQRSVVGRAKIDGTTQTWGVAVMGPVAPGEKIVVTGVVGREDREVYPDGDDKDKLGIVLSARPKPKTAEQAVRAIGDDTEPAHAI